MQTNDSGLSRPEAPGFLPDNTAEQLELFNTPTRLRGAEAIAIFHELEGRFKSRCYRYQYKPILASFGTLWLDEWNSEDVRLYRERRKIDGLQENGINREHSVVTRIVNAFYEWRRVKRVGNYNFEGLVLPELNPGQQIKKADERPFTRKIALSPAEFLKFCDYAHPRVRRICTFAVLTLLRRKDLTVLGPENFNRALRKLSGVQSKTGLPYDVPAAVTVSLLIGDQRQDYFCDFTNFRRLFDRAVRESGIEFQFRDLRRTGATQMLLDNVDLKSIQLTLGHADIEMTEQYLQPNTKHMQEAVAKLDDKFGIAAAVLIKRL